MALPLLTVARNQFRHRTMYWLDTLLLTLLGLGALLGLWSGFLRQVARMAALALALTATVLCNESATALLREELLAGAAPRLCQALAYVAVFLIVYLAVFFLARVLYRGVQTSDLEWLDRLGGALLGAGKICVALAALCLVAAHSAHPTTRHWLQESKIAPVLASGMQAALVCMPEHVRSELAQGVQGLAAMFEGKER